MQGQLVHIGKESVTLSVQSVGYEVFLPQPILQELALETHISFWIHTIVREDAIALYGFLTKQQRHLFVSLLKVDRIGPKMALGILSSNISTDQIIAMIQSKDINSLSALPKVGRKMAEQIVFRLKGHLGVFKSLQNEMASQYQTIVSTLLNLGFKIQDIEKALLQIPQEGSLQDKIKAALAILAGKN